MDRKSFILLVLFTTGMFFFNNWFFESNKPKTAKTATEVVKEQPFAKAVSNKEENFFVLENSYMQVVFSDIGGAVVEINLPFQSAENKKSIVLPIQDDKDLARSSPANALFPLKPYTSYSSSAPLSPKKGGYYPLLRRGIQGNNPQDISPSYYGLNVISTESKELASVRYKLKKITENSIVFEGSLQGKPITKMYKFIEKGNEIVPYCLDLTIDYQGDLSSLFLTSGVPEAEMISGSMNSEIKYKMIKKGKSVVAKGKLPKATNLTEAPNISWVSNSNGFFGIILQSNLEGFSSYETLLIPGAKDPTRLTLIDKDQDRFPAKKYPGYVTQVPLVGSESSLHYTIFAGPYDQMLFQKVDKQLGNDFSGALTMHGWFSFISEPFAKFLFVIMQFCYSLTHSWVFSIFLLTIVLRIVLFPLNNWQLKSMAKLQDLNPQITQIKTRYANDPKRMNMEILDLYKQKGVSPISGFLPIFIQMPFFIGMLDLLRSSFPLRGSSFIPGWIDNLTAPDVLFSWGYSIPLIGDSFHLLPFVLGGLTFLQQKITSWTAPSNKALTKEAESEANKRNLIVTAVFTCLFYSFPSGLNLYWIFSTALGFVQQLALSNKIPFLPKFKTR